MQDHSAWGQSRMHLQETYEKELCDVILTRLHEMDSRKDDHIEQQ